jgi:hypothetical protein
MLMTQPRPFTCTPEIAAMIISGLEVILGGEELEKISGLAKLPLIKKEDAPTVLGSRFSLAELGPLQAVMKNSYGAGGRDGIALHAGREFFNDFFRRFGTSLGLMDQKYRMLSTKKRINAGLNILAEALSKHFNIPFSVTDDCDKWSFRIEHAPAKKGWSDLANPALYFLVGVLQEYLLWAGGGKVYPVTRSEEGCKPLEISISKKALS